MSKIFDIGNKKINNFTKNYILSYDFEYILEIGCGTGRLLRELALFSNSKNIEGIDISKIMIKIAIENNKKHIKEGRVIIRNENFEKAHFIKNKYGLIYSVNTIFFWTDPLKKNRKIR